MRRTCAVTAVVVFAVCAGCGHQLDGPTPKPGSAKPAAEPQAVCVEQDPPKAVTLRGTGLSPMPSKVLGDKAVLVLPKVELVAELDISGAVSSVAPVVVPDDLALPRERRVHWLSQQEMVLGLDKELGLAPGLYAIRVTNANGHSATWNDQDALLVVPKPTITTIGPDLLCTDKDAEFTLTGDFFLRSGANVPTIKATSGGNTVTLKPAQMAGCRALPGPAGIEACREMTIKLPKGTLPAGDSFQTYTIEVVNDVSGGTDPARDPVGCHSTETVNLTIVSAPTITKIEPQAICEAKDTTLTITGKGFLTVDGAGPTLTLGGKSYTPTAGDCTTIPTTKQTVEICNTLTFTVKKGELGPGKYTLTIKNPGSADCETTSTFELEVVPLPTITSVLPTKLCQGGTLTIDGTGFHAGATVTIDGVTATTVSVSGDGQQITASWAAGLNPGGPYDVVVSNPAGCITTAAAAVTIVLGPQLFFADPPVVYNGIATQVTLWGSGIGGAPTVGLRPTGTAQTPTNLTLGTTLEANRVQVVVPKGTAAGDYDVVLTDGTGCPAVLTAGLKIVDQTTLKLTAIDPPFGFKDDNTAVTVLADSAVGGGFQEIPRLYLNPTAGGQSATGLDSVTFIDATRVTAVVPGKKASLPVGTYDVIAVNPDGSVGLLAGGFKVTALPPPTISNVTPGTIANKTAQTAKISGANFRQPAVTLRCIDATTGATVAPLTPTVNTSTAGEINIVVDGSTLGTVVCVVRVTNGDDGSYGDFSALVVTNPSLNLTIPTAGPKLTTGRRALAAVANRATAAARFIYAIGGDTGAVTGALDTVEVAPVDIFGKPSAFFVQQNTLNSARSLIGAATIGRCIYVVGGVNSVGVLDTVERGCLLDPDERPEIVDLDLRAVATAGLTDGLWYYRVSAVMPASHPSNPGGETLPSEPFPLLLPKITGKVVELTLHWSKVPGAVSYRIYRSPNAGDSASAATLLTTVTTTVACPTTAPDCTYVETGTAAGTEKPLTFGATGKWHVLATTLASPRQGAGVAIAPDPADTTGTLYNLYVIGGKGASTALATYQRLPITVNADGSQTVGTFTAEAAALGTARWQLAAISVGNAEAAVVTPPTHFIYAAGGASATGTTISDVDALEVLAGGALKAAVVVDQMSPARAGFGYAAAANFLFTFGGAGGAPSTTAKQAEICTLAGAKCTSGPPELVNWNTATSLTESRYLMGSAVQSGYIYIVGGQNTTGVSDTTEYMVW